MLKSNRKILPLYRKITVRKCVRSMKSKNLMEERKAKLWILAKKFKGPAKESDFEIKEQSLPPLEPGEFLAQAMYWSVDPYLRAYAHDFKINETMPGLQMAKHYVTSELTQIWYDYQKFPQLRKILIPQYRFRIISSKNNDYIKNSIVTGQYGWRTLTKVDPKKTPSYIIPVEQFSPLPVSLALSYAGLTGNTAFFGMTEIARPKKNQVVVISGAGGAVGSHAGQLAKMKGATVVGICGDTKKCEWLTSELGFDYAINYKQEDIRKKLKDTTDGVDIYWDNVGGVISSQVMNLMKPFGKVIVCGAISTYDHDFNWPPYAPEIHGFIYFKQLSIQGFLINSFLSEWDFGISQNLEMLKNGSLKYKEWITEGFENIPRTFIDMMAGKNIGKAIIKNSDGFKGENAGAFILGRNLSKQTLNI